MKMALVTGYDFLHLILDYLQKDDNANRGGKEREDSNTIQKVHWHRSRCQTCRNSNQHIANQVHSTTSNEKESQSWNSLLVSSVSWDAVFPDVVQAVNWYNNADNQGNHIAKDDTNVCEYTLNLSIASIWVRKASNSFKVLHASHWGHNKNCASAYCY